MDLERPYTTEARVRAELKNEDDAILDTINTAINDASRAVDVFVGHDFWNHEYTDPPYRIRLVGPFIFLPWPIIELATITIGDEEVDLDDLEYEEGGRVIDCTAVLEDLRANPYAELTGEFGYTLAETAPTETPPTDLPAPIVRATTMIAAVWTGAYAIERVGLDGQRVSIASSDIPKEALRLLQRYKPIVA